MEKPIDVKVIRDILERDNTVEIKKNKNGDIIILEVTKRIRNK